MLGIDERNSKKQIKRSQSEIHTNSIAKGETEGNAQQSKILAILAPHPISISGAL